MNDAADENVTTRARCGLLALNLFLLSPLFLYDLRLGQGGPDRTFFYLLPASVLGLAVLQFPVRRPLFLHMALFPLYVATAVDLYLIASYGMRLGSSTLLVIVENLPDAAEYLEAHRARVIVATGAFAAFYALSLVAIRDWRRRPWWGRAASTLLAVVALDAFFLSRLGGDRHLFLYEDRRAPFGLFSQSYVAMTLEHELRRRAADARVFSFEATRPEAPPETETYVLVVGESARPDRWGLYGAPRPTTPRLAARSDLVVFRNVVSQASVTKDSVPFIVTRGHAADPERTARERSVVSVFREPGFDTYWLSTQQRDFMTGAINRFASEAATQRFYEHRFDGALLPDFAEAVGQTPLSPAAAPKKTFIVLHTLGSHYHYPSRYPPDFARYPAGDLTSHDDIVNAYDDTVLYTDYFLSEVIRLLAATPGQKALFYVADHGENLRDDERQLFGHMMNNAYDLPVPMLAWFSPEYAARHPREVAWARANADRRLSTRHVFASLVGLVHGRLAGGDPSAPELSVLAPDVVEVPRLVVGYPAPFDFDVRYPNYPLGSSAAR